MDMTYRSNRSSLILRDFIVLACPRMFAGFHSLNSVEVVAVQMQEPDLLSELKVLAFSISMRWSQMVQYQVATGTLRIAQPLSIGPVDEVPEQEWAVGRIGSWSILSPEHPPYLNVAINAQLEMMSHVKYVTKQRRLLCERLSISLSPNH
jgi:hypothetical protein